jgi:lysophospholipase L1-like esterase
LGFHVRYPEARVEWSSLGVRGARVKSAATRSEGAIETLAQLSNPNLFVLWFGTNTAAAERVSLEAYEAHFRGLIASLKAGAPRAQCLVITPPDFGRREASCFLSKRERRVLRRKRKNAWARQLLAERREERVCTPDALLNLRKRGRYRYPVPEARNQRTWEAYKERCQHHTPPLVSALTEVQERVAREEGCALYNSLSAMGGEGAMQRWACSSPRWAQLDLVHLSLTGYEALGAHIAHSLRAQVGLDDAPPPPLTPPQAPAVLEGER